MPPVDGGPWQESEAGDGRRYFSAEYLSKKTLAQENVQAIRDDCGAALRAYRRFQPWGGYVVVHVDGGRVEAELHYGGGAPHRYLLKEAPKPQQ